MLLLLVRVHAAAEDDHRVGGARRWRRAAERHLPLGQLVAARLDRVHTGADARAVRDGEDTHGPIVPDQRFRAGMTTRTELLISGTPARVAERHGTPKVAVHAVVPAEARRGAQVDHLAPQRLPHAERAGVPAARDPKRHRAPRRGRPEPR